MVTPRSCFLASRYETPSTCCKSSAESTRCNPFHLAHVVPRVGLLSFLDSHQLCSAKLSHA